MRQDERRRAQNLRTKRAIKVASKAFEAKPTFDTLRELQSKIDSLYDELNAVTVEHDAKLAGYDLRLAELGEE